MGEYRLYTDAEKAAYNAPACELCGQHRHIRWTDRGDGGAHWVPRDAGCSNEACASH